MEISIHGIKKSSVSSKSPFLCSWCKGSLMKIYLHLADPRYDRCMRIQDEILHKLRSSAEELDATSATYNTVSKDSSPCRSFREIPLSNQSNQFSESHGHCENTWRVYSQLRTLPPLAFNARFKSPNREESKAGMKIVPPTNPNWLK